MFINKDYKIEAVDGRNVCILKRTIVKSNEVWMSKGHYSTPQGALKGLMNKQINGTGLKDFKTVCDKIDELYKLIDGLKIEGEENE